MAFWRAIVGYDGSEHAREALALAERLVDPDFGTLLLACAKPAAAAERTLAEGAQAVRIAVRVERHRLAGGPAAHALAELAARETADLVVVGSTHRGPLGRIVPGPTALRLLHEAPCSVAVPPAGASIDRIRRVAAAFDGSPEATGAVQTALRLAGDLHAEAVLVAVARDPHEPVAEALAQLAASAPVERRLLAGDPTTAIAGLARQGVDLLVAGSRARGAVRRAFGGSVSGALLRAARCPVLVVPRGAGDHHPWPSLAGEAAL